MFRKIREKISVLLSNSPGTIVILNILLINILFVFLSAAVITTLSTSGIGFWEAVFCTITMILDAGCIQFVVADLGAAGLPTVIVCLCVIIIGMILFTGAVIGYLTNYISGFIDNANGGKHKIILSDHIVIINWNSRASEIVNDLLYKKGKQKIVILVSGKKEEIKKELDERISNTITTENNAIKTELKTIARSIWRHEYRARKLKNNLTIVIREGDTFSTKQLIDISLQHAKSVIILNNEPDYDYNSLKVINEKVQKSNLQTIKTLMQVADITGDAQSRDDQKIVVEINDRWTYETVRMIIESKQVSGKCNIVPVNINKVLGMLLAQFSLMPELNSAYVELLSNKGVSFYAKETDINDQDLLIQQHLAKNLHSIPVSLMEIGDKNYEYYVALNENETEYESEKDITTTLKVKLNPDFKMERKNIIILGHNSKMKYIFDCFDSFRGEWNYKDGNELLNVLVIDDKDNLVRMDYFKKYPYVTCVETEIYKKELIMSTLENFIDETKIASILILSDDLVPNDEIDSNTITNLVYIRDILRRRQLSNNTDFKIDVIVEIINPKHYDIVKNYNINNVVISNRYISKMITQLGGQDVLFRFYQDILSYDGNDSKFESKEVYIKPVDKFFAEIPPKATAADLIRAVYNASVSDEFEGNKTHSLLLGYVKKNGEIVLIGGNQKNTIIDLSPDDKVIVFADH